MATSGLADVLAAIGLRSDTTRTEEGEATSIYDTILRAGQEQQAAQAQQNEAEAAILEERARLNLQTETAKKRAGQVFKTDLREPENAIATLALEQEELFSKMTGMKVGIDAKKTTSFLDSPVDYIANAFSLPTDVAEYNALVDRYNAVSERVKEINSLTQGTINTQLMLETKNSDAATAQALRIQRAQGAGALAKMQVENAGYRINALQFLQGADKERLNLAITEYNILKQEEMLALQREERTQRLQDKQDAEQLRTLYNLGRKSLGLQELDRPSFMLQLRIDEKEANDFIKRGAAAEVGSLKLAEDPGTAVLAVTKHQGRFPAGMEDVGKLLQTATIEARNTFQGQKVTPEQARDKINSLLLGSVSGKSKTRGYVQRMQQDMESPLTKSVPNIYKVGDVSTILTAAPRLQETLLYTQVLDPLVKAGVPNPSADQIVAAGITALAQKKIAFPVLVTDLTAWFKAGVLTNNSTKQYTAVGLPPQTEYAVKLNNGQLFFDEERVNLINENQVSAFLNKRIAAEAMKTSNTISFSAVAAGGTGGFGFGVR